MAITATQQVLYDGVRNCVVKLTGICDGTGNENSELKVDVSELNPPCARVRVDEVIYDVSYGLVKLAWDATPDVDFEVLEGEGRFDYRRHGGLNMVPDETANGDILLSTVGMELNSSYNIVLHLVKK